MGVDFSFVARWMDTIDQYGWMEEDVMALIKCPDCGKEFSEQAPTCPQCGRLIAAQPQQVQPQSNMSSMEKWWRISAILSVFSMVFSMFFSLFGWIGRLFRRD